MKMKNDRKKDQSLNQRGTGGGEVFSNRAGTGAFRVKMASWKNLSAAGDLTCCGRDARGPLGGRGRRVGGFGRLLGVGEKALKPVGGVRRLATWTLGGCHVARKRRLGGEKASFKGPDQPLAAAYRRLPPVAAAYFSMCLFFRASGKWPRLVWTQIAKMGWAGRAKSRLIPDNPTKYRVYDFFIFWRPQPRKELAT
ncbi:MAG: hypothetical protein JWR26_11 [Pedosphaera sp.]|nr:hypothetical protein [Pedosphaera sp.]